jgi:hypothetical protein
VDIREGFCSPDGVRVVGSWALLFAALYVAAPVHAQEESVHLDYDAATACPNRSAFIAEVTARTARARFVDEGAGVRGFRVTIRTEGDRSTGALVSDSGQAGAERRVSGKTCTEVVSALALITALAIDPTASTRSSVSPPAEPMPAPPPPAPPIAAPTVAPTVAPPPKREPSPSSSWELSGILSGEGSYGFTSEGSALVLAGGSLEAEAGPFARERKGPLVRVGALLLRSPSVSPLQSIAPVGDATFTLLAGRLSVSPLSLAVSDAFEMHPWLSAEVGQLTGAGATGGAITNAHAGSAFWLAVGQGLEGRWMLGSSFWVSLDARLVEPLVRQTFSFHVQDPTASTQIVITSVPFFDGILGVGVGARIL